MRSLLLPVLALVLLPGCTSPGGSGDYPDDYLPTSSLPGDLVLMDEDHPAWTFIADIFGMDENPDEVDPEQFEQFGEDGADAGAQDEGEMPEEVHVALYVRESDDQAAVFAAAARFADEEGLRSGFDPAEDCPTAEDQEEGYGRILQDGAVAVLIGSQGGDATVKGYVDDLAERIQDRTGADDLC